MPDPVEVTEVPGDAMPVDATASSQEATTLVEGDLLVEDVSIDGMCGVY